MTGLAVVLETLNAHYMSDAEGRLGASRFGGVPPRFVLGRAAEGCIWRFRADLEPAVVVRLAQLAGRERGVCFDGDLPAPPERLAAMRALLVRASGEQTAAPVGSRRTPVVHAGRVVGEIWTID